MKEVDVFTLVAQFAAALFVAMIWLTVCSAVPVLRRRIGLSYGIAAVLALIACLLLYGGPTPSALAAMLLLVAILFIQWRRALKKRSMEANTIISYENSKLF